MRKTAGSKKMLKIKNAKFITSAASSSQFIASEKPVIAVCGKSNVGKSSFINALAGQKKLARVSQEPGRTRLVNYFDFGEFILADLPGYGYARVSKAEKAKWAKLLDDFFRIGGARHVIALCDIRHAPTDDDLLMVSFLYKSLIPFNIVATKADKLSRGQQEKSLSLISSAYGCGRADIIPTSSHTGQGMELALSAIERAVVAASQTNGGGQAEEL